MKLTQLNCSRGAPMGRHSFGLDLEDIKVELERVPMVDGGYDVGGAYWGSPDDLWAYQHTDDTGSILMFGTLRADDREAAIAELLEEFPTWVILPENGTIIAQTIEFLQAWLARQHPEEGDEDTEDDIAILEDELGMIRWQLINVEVPLLGWDIVKDDATDGYRFQARHWDEESGLFDTDWEAAMALAALYTEKS